MHSWTNTSKTSFRNAFGIAEPQEVKATVGQEESVLDSSESINSIPSVLLIASAILMLQVYMANNPMNFENIYERADLRLFFLCMILGLTSWTGLCRLLRGESMKLREVEYVQASQTFGLKKISINVL